MHLFEFAYRNLGISTNPVIIRKILTQLKNAGLINVIRGTGGIELTRDLKDITFYDVYQAIEPLEDGDLFRFHKSPNPECPVGRNIHSLLDDKLKNIQEAMESEMKKYTLLEKDLENCYRNTLDMCAENSLKSVAFCCISTGVFHFPNKKA